MLTPGIYGAYVDSIDRLTRHREVERVAQGAEGSGCNRGRATLFAATGGAFLADRALGDEMFGAASLVVRCASRDEMRAILRSMDGQLTVTMQIDPADEPAARDLLPLLETKAGRLVANGWPTGVEVSHAMFHGGPFPATSDSRTTSVGAAAIERFLRSVCYQDLPEELLPITLREANPLGLPRYVS